MLALGLVNWGLNKSGIIRPHYLSLLKNILPHLHPRAEKGSLAWACPHPGRAVGTERSVCPAVPQRCQTHPFTLLTPKVCALNRRVLWETELAASVEIAKCGGPQSRLRGGFNPGVRGISEGFEKNRKLCRMGEKGERLKDNRRLVSSRRSEVTRGQTRSGKSPGKMPSLLRLLRPKPVP